jgi:Rrf2 family protein
MGWPEEFTSATIPGKSVPNPKIRRKGIGWLSPFNGASMRISKRAQYAIKALAALARSEGTSKTIAEISLQNGVPKKFLEHILLQVKASGLLLSKAGPKGGYSLARPAETISLAEVFQAIEEPLARPVATVMEGASPDSPLSQAIEDIREYTLRRLSEITLRVLAEDPSLDQDMEALMYYI